MPKTTIDIAELSQIIQRSVREGVHEAFEEFEVLTEDDWAHREVAMQELANGTAIDWKAYKKKRGLR